MFKRLAILIFAIVCYSVGASGAMPVSDTRYDWTPLAQSIVGDCTAPRDKAYKIYRWLCDNISYDTSYTIYHSDEAYEQRRGVCQAYSELFYRLGEAVGLRVDVISGRSKDFRGELDANGHAWVFVYTDGNAGILVDPTWGAGTVSKGRFTRNDHDDSWFDVDPHMMIFSHIPDEEMAVYQLIDDKIDFSDFRMLPPLYPNLKYLGIKGRDLFEKYRRNGKVDVPEVFNHGFSKLTVNNVPSEGTLHVGRYYDFVFKPKSNAELLLSNGSQYVENWQSRDGYMMCRFMPSEGGKAMVSVKDASGQYKGFISYKVAEPTADDIAALENAEPLLSPVWKTVANFRADTYGQHGVDLRKLLSTVKANRIAAVPEMYNKCRFSVGDVPWNGVLRAGTAYTFRFSPYEGKGAAIINGDDWYREWKQDSSTKEWYITVTPVRTGSLKLSMQLDDGMYWPCLEYIVR